MRVADIMTDDVATIAADASIREAARQMDMLNVGALPVTDGRRLVGIVTDRDVTVRATAAGLSPDATQVSEVMTDDVRWCSADDDVEDVMRLMSDVQIRRVPVLNTSGDIVGIVALGDLAEDNAPGADEVLREVSYPAEPDRTSNVTMRFDDPADDRAEVKARPNDEIQEELRAKLDADSDFTFEQIEAEALDGEVTLSGTVDAFPAKRRAVALAYTIPGVRLVTDHLRLRKPGQAS